MTADQTTSPALAAALDAFHPSRFGFAPLAGGWVIELDGLGPVAVAALGWRHAQLDVGGPVPFDALELVVELQRQTWGMTPEELVPANVLAVLADCGGSVLVAYQRDTGFTVAGWLGFAISLGSCTGTLLSHMLGVRPDARGRHDIGWYLKVLQGYQALRRGYHAASWTFDPMRGANARLNLEKLGGVVKEFTVDKYGTLRSSLYGDVPSDRVTADWDLLSPATARRLHLIAAGQYQPATLAAIRDLPVATGAALPALLRDQPPRIVYAIPGDIDHLMRDEPAAAIAWRREMRQVLTSLLTTASARLSEQAAADPTQVRIAIDPGAYVITGIATGLDDSGQRQSWYLFDRTSDQPGGSPP